MATSSITKEFAANDVKAFEALVKKTECFQERKPNTTESPSLAIGREALKKFSPR